MTNKFALILSLKLKLPVPHSDRLIRQTGELNTNNVNGLEYL